MPADEPRDPSAAPSRHTLAQSFRWAWDGLGGAAVRERNMRIHLGLGVLASAAASLLPLGGAERALLLLAVALVVAGEAANSALEAVVDLVSPAWNARARVAKDAAAGAVLALAGGSAVVLLAVAVPACPRCASAGRCSRPAALGGALAALAAGSSRPPGGARRPLLDVAPRVVGAGRDRWRWPESAEGVAGVAARRCSSCWSARGRRCGGAEGGDRAA